MRRHATHPDVVAAGVPSRTVRVLRSDEELSEAVARAAVHARRLLDRLDARAAGDARTAEHRARARPRMIAGDRPYAGARGQEDGNDRALEVATSAA